MLDSTNWLGYAAAVVLVLVSLAAAVLSQRTSGPQIRQPLPPIEAVRIDPGFIGKQAFGLWTLVCGKPESPIRSDGSEPDALQPSQVCHTNARTMVRGPNNALLIAAGFNVVMVNTQPSPAILFRLPPGARAAPTINFAVDNNRMFQAPLTCSEKECIARGALPQEAIEQMRAGRALSLIYTVKDNQQRDRKVRVEQLLHGFRESFDAMTRAVSV